MASISSKEYRKLISRFAHSVNESIIAKKCVRDAFWRMMLKERYWKHSSYVRQFAAMERGLIESIEILHQPHYNDTPRESDNPADDTVCGYAACMIQAINRQIDAERASYTHFCDTLKPLVDGEL